MLNLTKGLTRIVAGAAFAVAVLTSVLPSTARAELSRSATAGGEALYRTKASAAAAAAPGAMKCLTEALYFEARGESAAGQRAVAEVILNRVDHPAFPKSVCGVVNQGGQFSYKGGNLRFRDRGALIRAQRIAAEALAGAPRTLTNGATYFHTTQVRPSWTKRFTRTTRIGSHIFYRRGGQRLASN